MIEKTTKGARLKKFRQSLSLDQSEMAKKLGIQRSSYSGKETGVSDLTEEQLLALSELGLNINWLLTGQGEMLLESQQEKNSEIAELKAELAKSEEEKALEIIELKNKIAEIEASIRALNSQNNSVVNRELESK